jgi:hypothetical protein
MSLCSLCHRPDTLPKLAIPMPDGSAERRVHLWHDVFDLPEEWRWAYFQTVPTLVTRNPSWQKEYDRLDAQYGHRRPEPARSTKKKVTKHGGR